MAASLGSIDTIGLGGTEIDSFRCIRVLKAPGVCFPMSNVEVHLGTRSRHIFRAARRSLVVAVLEAISRNRFRNSKRVSMASRSSNDDEGDFRFWAARSDNPCSRRLVISGVAMSSNIDNEAVLVAISSSYIVNTLPVIEVKPHRYCPSVIRNTYIQYT